MRWDGNGTIVLLSGLNPASDRILHVLNGFEFSFAVRHTAGEIGNGRDKSAAIFVGERFDDDLVVRTLAHVLSVSQEGYQLLDIYWLNRSLERHRQNVDLARLRDLKVGPATARRNTLRPVRCADRLHILDSPTGWIAFHVLQGGAAHFDKYPLFLQKSVNSLVSALGLEPRTP